MKNPILVGGAGYLGQRIAHELHRNREPFEVIDPLIYRQNVPEFLKPHLLSSNDVRNYRPEQFEDRDVIWLASPHDFGLDSVQGRGIYYDLQVNLPLDAARAARSFVFLSSASVYRQAEADNLYVFTKRAAEQALLPLTWRNPAIRIIRPGTIWGGLRWGWCNRVETFPNRTAVYSDLPGPDYYRPVAPINDVVHEVLRGTATIVPVIGKWVTRDNITGWLRCGSNKTMWPDGRPFQEQKRVDLKACFLAYYNL